MREECPTCRVKMEQGTSTLAVTVIENIEHQCDHEGCDQTFSLAGTDYRILFVLCVGICENIFFSRPSIPFISM